LDRAARRAGSRWGAAGLVGAVCAGLEPETAKGELLAAYAEFGIPPAAMPRGLRLVAYQLQLEKGLDLNDPVVREVLGVSTADLLAAGWGRGGEALSQALGRAAEQAYYEGLLAPSAVVPGGNNLVLFPACLTAQSVRGRTVQPLRAGRLL